MNKQLLQQEEQITPRSALPYRPIHESVSTEEAAEVSDGTAEPASTRDPELYYHPTTKGARPPTAGWGTQDRPAARWT